MSRKTLLVGAAVILAAGVTGVAATRTATASATEVTVYRPPG